ncbi:MAG TPA: hypothetical protein D7I09_04375 [Candidatus Poseidoniales archaeon]|nr:MAG TPA: hypothetical protein D7I09_04375 [Candidatus Poseidoniales archaeon]HII18558.1 hypothetical protein [Candidatus Poseidoniaceae archaeon]|tara:strand:- start:150 stop:530 length:381 start_codon:yes stop_codon:yes gene_type:complete
MDASSILNTKVWLLIIAVMHMVMGVGGSYAQFGADQLALIGFFATVGTYLFYAGLMTEGQEQARLAAVLCGPVFVWFVISAAMGLEMANEPAAPFPQAIIPMILWGMPALCGVMGWNMDESTPTEA